MKKPPDPGGSSCYSHSSYFFLVFYCSSAPNSCFPDHARIIALFSRRNVGLLQSDLLSKLPSLVLKLFSPSSILHCAINLAIFMKEKSGKSDLLLYSPNTGAHLLVMDTNFAKGRMPCGSNLAFYAADWIRVSSKIPQPSYSYGTQGLGPKFLRAMLFEFFNESEGYNGYCKCCAVLLQADNTCLYSWLGLTSPRVTLGFSLLISSQRFPMSVLEISEGAPLAVLWTVLKLKWASQHLIVGLTWSIERIIHLASLCFLSLNFDFVFDYQVYPFSGSKTIEIGCFNELENSMDKKGGTPISHSQRKRIPAFLNTINTTSLPVLGRPFTWKSRVRGQLIYEKLDRAIGRNDWHNLYPAANITHGPLTCSDYCFLLNILKQSINNPLSVFS
ncbi:LOW QUALITY PROTEIN: hypothetical protein Cgig2_016292 [Carnegiea gigantea]|uniref:Uncharacterized protein n=1 Tax=Carnegiea gigantea TaxID=171969 RepID=A0A9Q1KEN6_9CARY|nr:LOW QUALITY PROTEIN: hypothetical protein Cgig2_016292 [Carnegiea gigantea]